MPFLFLLLKDQKLLAPKFRLSERIKLWNKYANIDSHVVKLNFIKKIRDLKQQQKIDDSNKIINSELSAKNHTCNGKSNLCIKVCI